MCFSTEFWNDKYLKGHTGWDLNSPSTPIKEYIDQLTNKDLKILIPGCGNAYEAEYLVEKGFNNITLIDISSVVCESLKIKFKDNEQVKILNEDFFKLNDHFDLIFEQTFFCALDPALRIDYVNKMHQLLHDNGKLVGLLFNIEFDQTHPPFGGSTLEYKNLFQSKFKFKYFEVANNSIKPRHNTELFICLLKI